MHEKTLKYRIGNLAKKEDNKEESTLLSPEEVEELSTGFGKGISKRTMLVTRGMSLKELHELSK